MSHTAEIIAVGTELLLGNIANTNAQEISESLSTLGINVFWHTVVGDNPIRLKEALDIARRRADILITTGGLGPTYDDLTKQTICEVFGKPLVLHGGTGIPADMVKKAISLGVAKINVNTECQLAFQEATRKYIEEGKDLQGKGFDPRKLLAPGTQAIKDCVKEKMELFGSIDKA